MTTPLLTILFVLTQLIKKEVWLLASPFVGGAGHVTMKKDHEEYVRLKIVDTELFATNAYATLRIQIRHQGHPRRRN